MKNRIYFAAFCLAVMVSGWFAYDRFERHAPPPRHRHSPAAQVSTAEVPAPARAFIESRCLDCHDSTSKKGGLNFEALSAKLDDAAVEAQWTRVFDRVQRGEMPPKGESRPPAPERDAFMNALGGFLSDHDVARHAQTGRVVWRRLNRYEYENTIHDLLAIDTPLTDLFPEDGSAHGFDTVSEGLRLSASQIEAYLQAADTALDAAINLRPRPQTSKEHVEFLELPRIKTAIAVSPDVPDPLTHQRYQPLFRALPDAVVMFINQANKATPFSSRATAPGLYRVRLSAFGFQNQDGPTVAAKLIATDLTHYRLAAAFDLPSGTPRVAEATVHLEKNELLLLAATGCGLAADGSDVHKVGAEKFTGSGIAAQWAEIEGPLIERWPPPSVQRVFGGIPIRPLAPGAPERAYQPAAAPSTVELDKAIATFAQRAFRRPAPPEEIGRYTQLAHDALAQGAAVEAAVRRCYKAILTSPEFLFLRETPGKLDDYALASRLSYFLWSTMPDDELLQLAAQAKLHDPATLHAETERLLASPRAHAFAQDFCGQWLALREIDATKPDKRLYPEFDELLQAAMVNETESFFEEVVHSDLGVATFIDSDFAMLNRRLADHYGIKGVRGEQFRKVSLPTDSHRGGLLTQASILKVTANGTLSSPVLRGVWVLKHLLGRTMQPPPPDAGSIEPDTRGSTTIREQLAKHRRSEVCAGCHKYMDPYGFALENYDVIGGWREAYRKAKGKSAEGPFTHKRLDYSLGLPVDPSGELPDGRKFANLDDLKKLLFDQQDVIARNFVNNLIAYATGAGVTFSDRAQVEAILGEAKLHSYPVRALIHAIVQSPLFLTK